MRRRGEGPRAVAGFGEMVRLSPCHQYASVFVEQVPGHRGQHAAASGRGYLQIRPPAGAATVVVIAFDRSPVVPYDIFSGCKSNERAICAERNARRRKQVGNGRGLESCEGCNETVEEYSGPVILRRGRLVHVAHPFFHSALLTQHTRPCLATRFPAQALRADE